MMQRLLFATSAAVSRSTPSVIPPVPAPLAGVESPSTQIADGSAAFTIVYASGTF